MGVIALLVVSALAIGEGLVILALLNRILAQAKVPPVEMPRFREPASDEPEAPRETPIFRVPFMS